MKKATLILVVAFLGVLLVASGVLALGAPYTHGGFATNSKGCGDCHITHSAGAAKLLNTSSSYQTTFCIGCHGKTSPFDVRVGQIISDDADGGGPIAVRWDWADGLTDDVTKTTHSNFSYAGGFQYSFSFDVIDGDPTVADESYSVHNVRGLVDAGINWAGVTDYGFETVVDGSVYIPGGTTHADGFDFECGSCHDPHAGGPYVNNAAGMNPRLLKEDIFDRSNMRVKMAFDADNLVTEYTYGFNTWCGSCHDVFDTSLADTDDSWRSGADKDAPAGDPVGDRFKYMHKFGVYVNAADKGIGGNPYVPKYMPLEDNEGAITRISCITCHRAHGSGADVSGLTWKRYTDGLLAGNDYNYVNGAGVETQQGDGSALLRLPDRDVCYACHGAAQYNHDDTH